jgi:hypothetical protein
MQKHSQRGNAHSQVSVKDQAARFSALATESGARSALADDVHEAWPRRWGTAVGKITDCVIRPI